MEDGKITRKSENLEDVFFPFPTCLSEADLKRGNISVADLLKVPISEQQKGCSGVCLLWAEDNFKKHQVYLQEPWGWSTEIFCAQGAGVGASARKMCQESAQEQSGDCRIAKPLSGI